tara:strand:- start:195 stop:440 length:246 start_codon:yes stop_codon:yes gene_type:complete
MKTELVKVENVESCTVTMGDGYFNGLSEFKTEFKTESFPGDPEVLILFKEVQVAETLKEFRELHGLTKEGLVEWLNENYEQ